MCNYTYHHNPTCGHIAFFNIDTCTAFTSVLRMAYSDSNQQPTSCAKTIHSHDLVSQTNPSLCFQCEQEWMQRATKRVKAMAPGKTLLDEYEEEKQSDFVQLEGLDCPPKCNDDDDAETDIFIDAGVDYFISGDENDEIDYENASEHDTDDDGESCPTNPPFASRLSSFFEQRQSFDFYFDYKISPILEEYVHVSGAVDDESSGDDDIELVYLDYPKATPDHGKIYALDSSSDSFENIEYFGLSSTSSHPETSFLDLADEEENMPLSRTPSSPRENEFKELDKSLGDAAPSVTGLLGRIYNGLLEIIPRITVLERINRVFEW